MKKLICIICPRGCPLEIDESTLEVRGNSCPRGKIYAESELTQPVRTVTTTVAIEGPAVRCARPSRFKKRWWAGSSGR